MREKKEKSKRLRGNGKLQGKNFGCSKNEGIPKPFIERKEKIPYLGNPRKNGKKGLVSRQK